MNNKDKKTKGLYAILAGALLVSSSAFIYQNFIYDPNAKVEKKVQANKEKEEPKQEMQTIYVAKYNLNSKSEINREAFKPIQVPKANGTDLPHYVRSIESVMGAELKGGLLKDEPLTMERVSMFKDVDGSNANLVVEINPDFATPSINIGDKVRVYTQDKRGKIKELYRGKTIVVPDGTTNNGSKPKNVIDKAGKTVNEASDNLAKTATTEDTKSKTTYLIRLTDSELRQYYETRNNVKLIVAKIVDYDLKK